MSQAKVAIYLINGFLDSGKTTLLRDTMNMDYFNDGQRTVLIRCEDGECEYDDAFLAAHNTVMVNVDEPEQLNAEFFSKLRGLHKPERVLMEYNGMWPMEHILSANLPRDWGIFQIISVIDGSTFELYQSNMQSMIVDAVSNSDMILFNRCKAEQPLANYKRSVRAVNRMAEIVFEDAKGVELEVQDILPYSLEADSITLEDADYGIWYLDIQEHPQRYLNKTISFKAQAMVSPKLPKGTFVPGRNAMTCCEDDIRFFGFLCKYPQAKQLKTGQWVWVTAEIRWENAPVYEGEGVVLYAKTVESALRPNDPLIYFR
ncbi:MAG: GTPase [Ruminococcaceae bacterium]|nr:GTPase [Oscillospiraceae bacterium]